MTIKFSFANFYSIPRALMDITGWDEDGWMPPEGTEVMAMEGATFQYERNGYTLFARVNEVVTGDIANDDDKEIDLEIEIQGIKDAKGQTVFDLHDED